MRCGNIESPIIIFLPFFDICINILFYCQQFVRIPIESLPLLGQKYILGTPVKYWESSSFSSCRIWLLIVGCVKNRSFAVNEKFPVFATLKNVFICSKFIFSLFSLSVYLLI